MTAPAVFAGEREIEVDVGSALPVSLTGLRRVLLAARGEAPEAVDALAAKHAPEWNRLFPGSVSGAPDISDLALSPSERRLHRESEQIFWILNFAARVVLQLLRSSDKVLVVRNAGECDLVSLRGLMRAEEWARLEGLSGRIVLRDFGARRRESAECFEGRRTAYLKTLQERMRIAEPHLAGERRLSRPIESPVDLEGTYLREVADDAVPPARRVAAAILAVRACFFSTNYEGAMFAAETGLRTLQSAKGDLRPEQVADAWDALDTPGAATPAIEIDKANLGTPDELAALFLRSMGVVHVFTGDHDGALAAFGRGLELNLPPEGYAHLRMFRALMLIKRLGQLPVAKQEIEAGLAHLKGRGTPFAALLALGEEKRAMACVGDLHDASATHLKINLISNVSVVQETAKRFSDAVVTWRRFEKISASWGPNFAKHHRYRLAGLLFGAGEREQAMACYREAYANAEQLGDALHRQVIAVELGRHALDAGQREEAADWYGRAEAYSRELGDPFALAQSLVGGGLARGASRHDEALRFAAMTTTYPEAARKLMAAVSTGVEATVRQSLPLPRSKLNRPFDLVNL
jgi:tetratricopeptide (TPR) repeat protein